MIFASSPYWSSSEVASKKSDGSRNRIAGTVEGDDKSSASSVKATFTGTLNPVAGGTEAAFQVDANLRGRLAQFGGPVIAATAKKLTAEFAKNLRVQLEK